MSIKKEGGALSREEKRIVKALIQRGQRNQDIQALINVGRAATVNSARITEVKKNHSQAAATEAELAAFEKKKQSFDPATGLNLYDDERLIRAREAMILAVQIFNNPALNFKTENFAVLAQIAWTYLLHEHYARAKIKIYDEDGRSLLLGQMIGRQDCPLPKGVRANLKALKIIRDEVEHKILGPHDGRWLSLFQACCMNFEKSLCNLFGPSLSLAKDLSFALQFSKMSIDQLASVNNHNLPEHIQALDARLQAEVDEEDQADLTYQFRVIYTLDAASKGRAHFEFLRPDSAEGKEIRNILVQYKAADHLYPHKPGSVVKLVTKKTGINFTSNNHTQAWRLHKVRPLSGSKQPENTDRDFCIFHAAHGDYTYSEAWVTKLIEEVRDQEKFAAIKSVKVGRRD
jgi:hypothetical protein